MSSHIDVSREAGSSPPPCGEGSGVGGAKPEPSFPPSVTDGPAGQTRTRSFAPHPRPFPTRGKGGASPAPLQPFRV
jgi:hypothetical protein